MLHPRHNFSWSGKECEPISSLLDPDTFQILSLPSFCFTTAQRSTLISSSRVFVWSRVAPDKNISKHERQHGCLPSKAAAKQRCRVCWLPLIFSTKPQLMQSISKETFSQIRAARMCQAAALVPGATFVLVWQEVLLEMMEYPDRSHHLSPQLSDESSPSQLWGETLLFECFFGFATGAAWVWI